MPYTYTLAWEARNTGMPLMRALWLHYPKDKEAVKTADEFLWGSDLLIAPVYEKAATNKKVYLPHGEWYDWWTNTKQKGDQTIVKAVDLKTMPIYVRAGAIIPVDSVRQYTSEVINTPTTLKIYSGSDGACNLYEDDGISMEYSKGKFSLTEFIWNDANRRLIIQPKSSNRIRNGQRTLRIELIPQMITKEVLYNGNRIEVAL
jgi:alpha-glucosidase/alpha-D-xyloside xylohydrolase